MRFKNKMAIITGAASSKGLLSAQNLCKEGGQVVLTDVNREAVEAAGSGLRKNAAAAIGIPESSVW